MKSEMENESMYTYLQREDVSKRVSKMIQENRTRFALDFNEIYDHDPDIATTLITNHRDLSWVRDCVVQDVARVRAPGMDLERWRAVLYNLPHTTPLRKLDTDNIGHLTQVDGVVVSMSEVQPMLVQARFVCVVCEHEWLVPQKTEKLKWPGKCDCDSRKYVLDEERSVWVNSQTVSLQESHEELPPGQIPRQLQCRLTDDLVETVRPGDRAVVVGILRLKPPRREGRLYDYLMEGDHVQTREAKDVEITEADRDNIKRMGTRPDIEEWLVKSVAPTVYGYYDIKRSILYLLVGGVSLEEDDVRIRGNIHVLLVGDPGVAKSQILTAAARASPRGLLTAGKTSTSAGLTATVQKEPNFGRYVLEAGALVLSDRGVCCIDEIDKMREEDREAIHFPMEQQTVPIAKGGIVATLNARTSILGAANPKYGRYNHYSTVADNIDLPVTILTRFDLIWVMKDKPNVEQDGVLAKHILDIRKKSGSTVRPPIALPLLKKYVAHASKLAPKLTEDAMTYLESFYVETRSVNTDNAAVSITARSLEAGIRIAEARAKIHLREEVTLEDAMEAVKLVKLSLMQVGIDTETGQLDADVILTGKPRSLNDKLQTLLQVIRVKTRNGNPIDENDVYEIVANQGWTRVETTKLLGILSKDGTIFYPRPGQIKAVQQL